MKKIELDIEKLKLCGKMTTTDLEEIRPFQFVEVTQHGYSATDGHRLMHCPGGPKELSDRILIPWARISAMKPRRIFWYRGALQFEYEVNGRNMVVRVKLEKDGGSDFPNCLKVLRTAAKNAGKCPLKSSVTTVVDSRLLSDFGDGHVVLRPTGDHNPMLVLPAMKTEPDWIGCLMPIDPKLSLGMPSIDYAADRVKWILDYTKGNTR